MKKNFNERLCEVLKERGMSQKELAEKAGITESAVSHYVRGDRFPRVKALAQMADALGITSDYLMNGSINNMDNEVVTAKRLIARNVDQMSREEKMEIVEILLGND